MKEWNKYAKNQRIKRDSFGVICAACHISIDGVLNNALHMTLFVDVVIIKIRVAKLTKKRSETRKKTPYRTAGHVAMAKKKYTRNGKICHLNIVCRYRQAKAFDYNGRCNSYLLAFISTAKIFKEINSGEQPTASERHTHTENDTGE